MTDTEFKTLKNMFHLYISFFFGQQTQLWEVLLPEVGEETSLSLKSWFCSVTSQVLLAFSVPQFPPLENGDTNGITYFIGWW